MKQWQSPIGGRWVSCVMMESGKNPNFQVLERNLVAPNTQTFYKKLVCGLSWLISYLLLRCDSTPNFILINIIIIP